MSEPTSRNDARDATVLREDRGDVVVLILNRPAKRNSLIWDSWSQLGDALDRVVEERAGAVVLTGAGGFFSAGGDLKSGPARGAGPMAPAARLEHAQRVLLRLRSMPVPAVAAVEGGAIGIGWSLALSCDLVVAARDAFFSAPFVARGVVPDGGAAWYLTERLGRHRASELLLLGGRLAADEAQCAGIVNSTAEPGRAAECAVQIAATIAAADRATVEMSKRLLASAEGTPLDTFFALELATATVAQQRGTAAAARSSFE